MAAPSHVKHRMDFVPGAFKPSGFAVCGVRKDETTEFTCYGPRVTCPGCRRGMRLRRAVARVRNGVDTGRAAP